jgi:hypothetical protein
VKNTWELKLVRLKLAVHTHNPEHPLAAAGEIIILTTGMYVPLDGNEIEKRTHHFDFLDTYLRPEHVHFSSHTSPQEWWEEI